MRGLSGEAGRLPLPSRHAAASIARLVAARFTGARVPFAMTFNLTHRCNLRCDHCTFPANPAAELSTAEVRSAIDELTAAGMARVSFSGGEPLLRDDLPDLVAHARRRGLFTSLNTNGLLARNRLAELAPNLGLLVVSLDGPPPHHDRVRRRDGAFRAALDCIIAARSAGVRVSTITVLRGGDLEVVQPVLALAREHGFWAYFQPQQRDCFDVGAGRAPDDDTVSALADALRRGRAAGLPVAASDPYLDALVGRRPVRCETCLAGRLFGSVLADGAVVPCPLLARQAGYQSGITRGWRRAFHEMPAPPPGPGCLISPYRELDQILRLRVGAIRGALRVGWSSPGKS